MPHSITLAPSFKRRLAKKEPKLQAAIAKTVSQLGEDPRTPGLHTHAVQGTKAPKVFEAYVDTKNRVTWCWGDGPGAITLLAHCNHDVLKNPLKSN